MYFCLNSRQKIKDIRIIGNIKLTGPVPAARIPGIKNIAFIRIFVYNTEQQEEVL